MRLLYLNDEQEVCLTADLQDDLPEYTILSHTWGRTGEEVTFADIQERKGREKIGYKKLEFCATQSQRDGYKHFWVDTCCIDKAMPTELNTAIRSMYAWYKNSAICYVWLDFQKGKRGLDEDETWMDKFKQHRWFKRGWTLQELLAPKTVRFFARDDYIGDKAELCYDLQRITGIDRAILKDHNLVHDSHVAHYKRLQWTSERRTTQPEDVAYCMMGICQVSFQPLYGEGADAAWSRLLQEITDAWGRNTLNALPHGLARRKSTKLSEQEILDALRFDSMDSRRQAIKKQLSKTCQWVRTTAQFKEWMKPAVKQGSRGILWVSGKAGAGKSVLVKYLDDHISTSLHNKICISFYFNARGYELEKTVYGMYRSVLSQLISAAPDLLDEVKSDQLIVDNSAQMVEQIQTFISTMVCKQRFKPIYCFIDALDECLESEVQAMIIFFHELSESATEVGASLFICFASRHYPTMQIPSALRLVLETEAEHGQDIQRYVTRHLREELRDHSYDIAGAILRKANGIFLWVYLVVDILNKEFGPDLDRGRMFAVDAKVKHVNDKLNKIPSDLFDLFDHMLQRDRRFMDEFILCLQWIMYSRRPLKIQELYFSIMAGLGQPQIWHEAKLSTAQMETYLHSSSKGFAEVIEDGSVQFIHETVRHFLRVGGLDRICETSANDLPALSHQVLYRCCLSALETSYKSYVSPAEAKIVGKRRPQTNAGRRARAIVRMNAAAAKTMDLRFPFFRYATTNVLNHADQANLNLSHVSSGFDLATWRLAWNVFQKHKTRMYGKDLNLSYVCADQNLANLIRYLDPFDDQALHCQRYHCPLVTAFATRSRAAARAILVGQNADNPDEIIDDVFRDYERVGGCELKSAWSTLSWAMQQGHEKLALHLLRDAFDVQSLNSSMGGLPMSAIHLAAEGGSVTVARRILSLDPSSLNVLDARRQTPLLAALRCRNLDMANFLHECSVAAGKIRLIGNVVEASLDSRDGGKIAQRVLDCQETFWQWAAFAGDQALVKVVSYDEWFLPHKQVYVQKLLDAGADVHAQYRQTRYVPSGNWGPISHAARLDDIAIAEVLVEAGADPKSYGSHPSTAMIAAYYDNIYFLRWLATKDVDFNVRDSRGCTALHYACRGLCGNAIRTLVSLGADKDIENNRGQTALDLMTWLARHGRFNINDYKFCLQVLSCTVDDGAFEHFSDDENPDMQSPHSFDSLSYDE